MNPDFSAIQHMSSPEQRTLVTITIAVVAIAFAVSGYYYFGPHRPTTYPAVSSAYVEIQSTGFPADAVVTVNHRGSLGLSVEGQGTAIVVGEASLGTTTKYYLIMDPVTRSTELYQQSVANPKTGLMQLTQSGTQKSALSVDMLSGDAAYVSAPISAASTTTSAHVVVWDPVTKKEIDFGVGSNPVLLPGGFFVVFERDNTLMSVQTQTMKEFQLITIPSTGFSAIDQKHLKVALYDTRSSSVRVFSLIGSVELTAESTAKIAASSTALAFDDSGKPLSITVINRKILIADLGGTTILSFSQNDIPGGQPLSMVKIDFHYE